MKILLKTAVQGTVQDVYAKFDNDLLVKLTPPGIRLDLIQVENPEKVGAIIHIKVVLFGIFRQEWKNYISEVSQKQDECYFVDEGRILPRVLKYWRHKHIVRKKGNHVEIVDDITYTGAFGLLSWAMYPFLWAQFAYRKPKYRQIFGKV